MITRAQLYALAPKCQDPILFTDALNHVAAAYGIDTDKRFAHFLAQMLMETARFTRFEENLNYSAEALHRLWPSHFSNVEAALYARDPEKIANRVYANRMGNGDEASGDGWLFRGRGCLMLTGRFNYASAEREMHFPYLTQPDAMAECGMGMSPVEYAAKFWVEHGCNALADQDDIEGVTRAINGGLTGLADREKEYANVLTVLHQTSARPPEPSMPDTVPTPPVAPAPPAAVAAPPPVPLPTALDVSSVARMALGGLAFYLAGHKLLPAGTTEAQFVNEALPLVVWFAGVAWIWIKNRKTVERMWALLNAPPPAK